MRLAYRILWVEDNKDWYDEFPHEDLKLHVEDHGFDLDCVFWATPATVRAEIDTGNYDLLVIDFNLSEDGSQQGSNVIQAVQRQGLTTDVVFYSQSAQDTLYDEAKVRKLEGVFFSTRRSPVLLGKIKSVFDLTVRKVVDVENMRGIVMASVAELDHLMKDVLTAKHDLLDVGTRNALRGKIARKMIDQARQLTKLAKSVSPAVAKQLRSALEALANEELIELSALLEHRGFDSSKRKDSLVSLCAKYQYLNDHEKSMRDLAVLLEWRNALAHQRPVQRAADGVALFTVGGKPEPFGPNETKRLRQALRRYRRELNLILEKVIYTRTAT